MHINGCAEADNQPQCTGTRKWRRRGTEKLQANKRKAEFKTEWKCRHEADKHLHEYQLLHQWHINGTKMAHYNEGTCSELSKAVKFPPRIICWLRTRLSVELSRLIWESSSLSQCEPGPRQNHTIRSSVLCRRTRARLLKPGHTVSQEQPAEGRFMWKTEHACLGTTGLIRHEFISIKVNDSSSITQCNSTA